MSHLRSQTRAGAKSLTRTYNNPECAIAKGVKGDESRSFKLEGAHKKSQSSVVYFKTGMEERCHFKGGGGGSGIETGGKVGKDRTLKHF